MSNSISMEDEERALQEILEMLLRKTRAGSIKWSESDREDLVRYQLGTSTVLLSSIDEDGARPYRLDIANQNGRIVATARGDRRSGARDAEIRRLLDELYPLAIRSSLQVEQTLSSVLNLLKEE